MHCLIEIFIYHCFTVGLVNGVTKYEGVVEFYDNGIRSTPCNVGWDFNIAKVVCNELGLGKPVYSKHNGFIGPYTGSPVIRHLNCSGSEWSIRNCSRHLNYCNYSRTDGIKCDGGKF